MGEAKFPIEKFQKEVAQKMPPVLEIARLAAMLAAGNQITKQSARVFAAQAIELWEKCKDERAKRIDVLAIYARAAALKAEKRKLPRPKSFPASLDDFLRCMMPGTRAEDRAKFHREYARQMFRDKVPTDDEVADCVAREKKEEISAYIYEMRADDFRRWLKEYKTANRQRRAQAGANALKLKRQKNG